MKKLKIPLVLACLYGANAQAQFFGQKIYNPSIPATSIVSDVHVTSIHSNGFLTTSLNDGSNFPFNDKPFDVRKTDNLGNFSSAKDFFTAIKVYKHSNCSAPQYQLGQAQYCYGATCIETGNAGTSQSASNYAFAASCHGTYGGYYCLFGTLDVFGVVVNRAFYDFPSTANGATQAFISESPSSPGNYYITGSYSDSGITYMYILSVSVTGSVNWSATYNCSRDMIPCGILESPYNSAELVIAGTCVFDPLISPYLTLAQDGFLLNVSAGSGVMNFFNVYGDDVYGAKCNEFTSIAPAASTYGGSNGYVIGGKSDQTAGSPGIGYAWMLKLDPSGNFVWNTMLGSTTTFRITSVLERPNTTGSYDYYGADQLTYPTVYKLDDSGTLFSGGPNRFEYNSITLNATYPVYITDLNLGGANDGLQVYTTDPTNAIDNYFVKAYFDGTSGCNEMATNETQAPGPTDLRTPGITISPGLTQGSCPNFTVFNAFLHSTDPITTICSNTYLGASNARITGVDNNVAVNSGISVLPNPVSEKATLSLNTSGSDQVKVEIYNSLGQLVKKVYDSKNDKRNVSSLEIDFTSLNVEPGLYFVHTTVNSKTTTEKLIYSK